MNSFAVTTRLAMLGSLTVALSACGAGSANLRDGSGPLHPCEGGPHCVSSESSDPKYHVERLTYKGSREHGQEQLINVLKTQDGSRIVDQKPGYVYAIFTSPVFRFVDDVEFMFSDQPHQIEVRSSSRIGYYDFGVNRTRVENIRSAFHSEDAR
jgi:uncharacterized protein (DUF1499 family)